MIEDGRKSLHDIYRKNGIEYFAYTQHKILLGITKALLSLHHRGNHYKHHIHATLCDRSAITANDGQDSVHKK